MGVSFFVSRSIDIAKPSAEVFPHILNFSEMNKWSPWLVTERSATTKILGTQGKPGAIHTWDGDITGAGEMELLSVKKNQQIKTEVRFTKPWKSKSKVDFEIADNGDNCTVSWNMQGSLPWFMFWMKSSMELWIGMDYERGLRMLKEYCETDEILTNVQIKGESHGEDFHYLGVKTSCSLDEIGLHMAADFQRLEDYIKSSGVEFKNPAFSIYHQHDIKKRISTYTCGVSTPSKIEAPEGFVTGTVTGGKALVVEHTGSYENLGNAWSAGFAYLMHKKIKQRKGVDPLEVYTNHPKMTAPKDLHTRLYFPLK